MTAAAPLTAALETAATSPLQIELTFVLNLTPEQAFDLVAHRLPEWFTAIHTVTWDDSKSLSGARTHGACSERSCDFDGKALKEVIVSYEPGRRYSYSVDMKRSEMKMPLEDHLGSFDLEAVAGGCLVVWRQHFKPKWFVPGAMLRWQMGERMMRPAVEKLLATHGGRWER
ncbi:MAG: SRPBCC family protein [Archangiaceae bacterium]|nr:SRPBCC family protein [Archangiaceae bacterium]